VEAIINKIHHSILESSGIDSVNSFKRATATAICSYAAFHNGLTPSVLQKAKAFLRILHKSSCSNGLSQSEHSPCMPSHLHIVLIINGGKSKATAGGYSLIGGVKERSLLWVIKEF